MSAPTIPGFPAEIGASEDQGGPDLRADRYVRLVVLRRADLVGGTALVLAGVAANISLWLPWARGGSQTGITLVRRGFEALDSSGSPGNEFWPPVAIVLGGGLLVVLGMLLFVPAHTHRLLGVLALVVALAAAAGVGTLLAAADWSLTRFGPGLWCGVAVAGFGLLGALKAMLTLPLVTTVEPEN
jgi:hypothetical protein